jgi:hypothetical protein
MVIIWPLNEIQVMVQNLRVEQLVHIDFFMDHVQETVLEKICVNIWVLEFCDVVKHES